jgi:hypothetical protein
MVIKEWGEIRQLYTACRPRHATVLCTRHQAWAYWCILVLRILLIFLGLIVLIDMFGSLIPVSAFGFPVSVSVFGFVTVRLWIGASSISPLVIGLLCFVFEKACANKYKIIYTMHGLRHYPWWKRPLYLHYSLFLCALIERPSPASREMIAQLRSFADIAGRPPLPESRLLQPHYIVPYIVLLNLLLLEVLKKTNFLEGREGILILFLCVYVLVAVYGFLREWHRVTKWGQSEDRNIQRFLQWAECDIEEAQLLRTRRLRAEMPNPHVVCLISWRISAR